MRKYSIDIVYSLNPSVFKMSSFYISEKIDEIIKKFNKFQQVGDNIVFIGDFNQKFLEIKKTFKEENITLTPTKGNAYKNLFQWYEQNKKNGEERLMIVIDNLCDTIDFEKLELALLKIQENPLCEIYQFTSFSYSNGIEKTYNKKTKDNNFIRTIIFQSSLLDRVGCYINWDFDLNSRELFNLTLKAKSITSKFMDIDFMSITFDSVFSNYSNIKSLNKKDALLQIDRIQKLSKESFFQKKENFIFLEKMLKILHMKRGFLFSFKAYFKLRFGNFKSSSTLFLKPWKNKIVLIDNDLEAKKNNYKKVTFEEYKTELGLFWKSVAEILKKHEIRYFPIGLSMLGHKKESGIIWYDDDIDISINLYDFYSKLDKIKIDFERIGLKLLLSEDWAGPTRLICVNKITDDRIFWIFDERYNLDTLSSVFVDFVYYNDNLVSSSPILAKHYGILDEYKKYNHSSKKYSKFIYGEIGFYEEKHVIKNSESIKRFFWNKRFKRLNKKYMSNLLTISELPSPVIPTDKIVNDLSSWYEQWKGVLINDFEKSNFEKSDGMIVVKNIDYLYKQRYGSKPEIYNDRRSKPSHLPSEKLFILYKDQWQNFKGE